MSATIQGIVILLMLSAIIITSINLAYVGFRERQLLTTLQELEQEEKTLQAQWSQLLLEQSTWSSFNRIESTAKDQLNMIKPSQENMEIIK